jgi:hypothetical protein
LTTFKKVSKRDEKPIMDETKEAICSNDGQRRKKVEKIEICVLWVVGLPREIL